MDKYLVKKAEIDDMEARAKEHFLNPNALRASKSLGDLTGLAGFGFHIVEVAPGKNSTEFHVHSHEEECVYILSGRGLAFVGDEEHEVGAGDFIGYRAGGKAHSLTNTGDETLKYIVVGQRRDFDICDYPNLNKRLYRQRDTPSQLVDFENIETLGGPVINPATD
ncbi:cupin domain-containing protein [Kiloniella antarctica]|uniref:Cupin domain-containing protein n=1 Tax=Kiloniella antarctica TaxID=1550907 RepID=A0ABW5BG24_9PROT